MNFTLLGYILAWIGIIYSVSMTILTFLAYSQLSSIGKRLATITLGKEILIFIVALVYIITYYIS